MSSATPPAIVSTAAPTIVRGSILRYLSRSGSSTHEASGSPSCRGIAAPPVPTITLAIRSGCAAAANKAADVPTSGATMCGLPRSASAMSWVRKAPIARGDRRFSRRSDAPNPGRSTANRRACSASVAQIGANAYKLSGQGLVSSTAGSCAPPLSAYRIHSPSIVRNCALIDVFSEVLIETPSGVCRCGGREGMWRQALAASQCLALIGRACSAACRYGAAQNEQWWREAKSLITIDPGARRDSTRCWLDPPNEGHRRLDSDEGSPLAAKLAH